MSSFFFQVIIEQQEKIAQLESEKSLLIRELFQLKAQLKSPVAKSGFTLFSWRERKILLLVAVVGWRRKLARERKKSKASRLLFLFWYAKDLVLRALSSFGKKKVNGWMDGFEGETEIKRRIYNSVFDNGNLLYMMDIRTTHLSCREAINRFKRTSL